jgi:hypothetical protein
VGALAERAHEGCPYEMGLRYKRINPLPEGNKPWVQTVKAVV